MSAEDTGRLCPILGVGRGSGEEQRCRQGYSEDDSIWAAAASGTGTNSRLMGAIVVLKGDRNARMLTYGTLGERLDGEHTACT